MTSAIARGIPSRERSADTGSFSNISGAIDPISVSTMLNNTSRYRLRAVCNATHDTVYTAEKLVTRNNWLNCYCIPAGENNGDSKIVRVKLNEIDSYFSVPSGNPVGYNSYNSPTATIYKGASNPLVVFAYGDPMNVHNLIVYIDYNHDGVFSASELIGSGGPDDTTPALDIPFIIPASALDGLTRMRVRCIRVGTESPCGTGSGGSTHSQTGDYYVNINPAPAPTLSLKIYFSGFYSGGSLVPAMYNGGACPNSSMCDSVTIELRNSTSPYTLAYSAIGALDVSGNISLSYPVSAFGNAYYIAVKHRNSLETWSKNPVILYPAITLYDFTK